MTKDAESNTITLTIFPELRLKADGEEATVNLAVSTVLKVDNSGKTLREDKESVEAKVDFRIGMFENEEALWDWWSRLRGLFYETLPATLIVATGDHLHLVGNAVLAETHPEEIGLKEFIEEQAKYRARELKRILRLSVVGNFSAWTRTDLARAVRVAVVKLKKERAKVTLDAVAKKLKETHGEIAPNTGEALGVLLRRKKLKWGDIKNRQ